MNIVTSINKNFIQHFCSMCSSLILNSREEKIDIYVLHSDLGDNDINIIAVVLEDLLNDTVNIHFVEVEENRFSSIPIIESHLSIQTLFRILLTELLPSDIEKLIYLDSDLVLEDSISQLFSLEINDYYVAAVPDFNDELAKNQNISSGVDYFNSGVMLVNLKKWREGDMLNKCLNYAFENKEKLRFPDQDILNGVLNGNWLKLDLSWNVTRMFYDRDEKDWEVPLQESIKIAKTNPKIIHYTTWKKPWFYLDDHPFKEKYFYYLNQTKFKYNQYFEKEILLESDIVVFGASLGGEKMEEFLSNEGLKVKFFTDNNEKKWGQTINGIEIISPQKLQSMSNPCIVIASLYEKEISEQLEKMNYSKVVPLIYN
ncbi:glycosyltransferase family 8 protein [Lysinibacillus capsici]|uniref:glycosyltransferase family 8 protein n=1 Tax=Lysinibacillus capsici TaxID=2115968 RepID=UPI0034E5AF73